MEPIRAIIYGVGTVGRVMTRLMVEKGVLIVGAIDLSPSLIGKDLGDVAGLGHKLNLSISNQADIVLSENKADIVIAAIFDEMEKMYPVYKRCVENGMNVMTTASEVLYPWMSSPELSAKLDRLAKKHGVTVTGCGNQDFYLVNAASLLTGLCQHLESVTLRIQTNTENYGLEMSRSVHVGESKEDFERAMRESGKEPMNFMTFCLESIINDLGLSVKHIEQRIEPAIADVDTESRVLSKIIKKGFVTGTLQTVQITTTEGPQFRSEGAFKMFAVDQEDTKEWIIKGTPEAYMKFGKLDGAFTTCTQMVNRIPDIINSEPGLITIEKLPKLKYRPYPLHYHVRKD